MNASVLVASVAGTGCLLRLLRSLRGVDAEVIVADRTGASPTRARQALARDVTWRSAPGAPLVRLRRLALDAANTPFVAVVEDHAIAPAGWLGRLLAPLAAHGVVAVAGPVRDVSRTATEEAAFACDYAPLARPRRPARLPGMNTAYRAAALRAALGGADPDTLWERAVHPRLDGDLAWASDAALHHDGRAGWGSALGQRYLQGRLHPRRARHALVTVGLPVLLTGRTLTASGRRSLPLLGRVGLLHTAGALGELVGALAGPGRAGERLR